MTHTIATQRAMNHHRLTRDCQTLLGIVSGILADNVLSHEEVRFLNNWLANNPEVTSVFPGDILAARLNEVMCDGIITADELDYLKHTLEQIIGGTLQETGTAGGLSALLPVQEDAEVIIAAHRFCFTGEFMYGTRAACTRATESRGGIVLDGVRKDLGYLVIGALASPNWVNTSYGRKIEKAISYWNDGLPIAVIHETQWVAAL